MSTKKTTEKAAKPEGEVKTRKRVIKKAEPQKEAAPEVKPIAEETPIVESHAIIVETASATPAVPHEPEIKIIEEKAAGIWSKIKAWKWFWWVVAGLALLLVISVCVWINSAKNKRAEVRLEQKKEEAKQIEVKEDTTLLQLRRIEADAINEFLEYRKKYGAVVDAAIKRNEYETKTMPAEIEKIKQENIQQHEKNNNPNNSDDDIRRNLQQQMSKPKVIRPR